MDVFIRYPQDSVVDIEDVTAKLVTNIDNPKNQTTNSTSGNGNTDNTSITELKQKNSSLFWGLVIFCIIIFIAVLIILFCNCCPGCYFYNSHYGMERSKKDNDENDITVLTVKNGQGQELKDAKFVEVLRSAKNRIRSATFRQNKTEDINGNSRLVPDAEVGGSLIASSIGRGSVRNNRNLWPKIIRTENGEEIMIFEADGGPSSIGNSVLGNPRTLEDLEAESMVSGNYRQSYDLDTLMNNRQFILQPHNRTSNWAMASNNYLRRAPNDASGRIFKVLEQSQRRPSRQGGDDVQVWSLNDETRRGETYKKIGEAEVLNLEDGAANDTVMVDHEIRSNPPGSLGYQQSSIG